MKKYLDNISIVLVEPKNAGNIGSTVRAMKNMGIKDLRLVNPVEYRDVGEQRKMGYRSQEIIKASRSYPDLVSALEDISYVMLATTRKGKWKKDFVTPRKAAELIGIHIEREKVAVVFGREDKGVTIDESQLANCCINIPSAVSYPSLNLSQAVMVIVYEIYQYVMSGAIAVEDMPKMAKKSDFLRLADNIWDLMKSIEFREEEKGLFHRSLKRALNRTLWTNGDIAVFDRACKQMRWYADERTIKNPGGKETK
jgi:TrmH family RNA methyltransferase